MEPEMGDIRNSLDHFHTQLRRKCYFQEVPDKGPDPPEQEGPISFHHYKFKYKSYWSPPGPHNLETMIMFNEQDLLHSNPRKPKHNNLPRGERKAIHTLFDNSGIIIKPADKGSAVVIMNTLDYIAEAKRQLSNTKHYQKTAINLTQTHSQAVNEAIDEMYWNHDISKKCWQYLTVKNAGTPQFYMLPKIHKAAWPPSGRPIVSANGCQTEKILALIDHFLQPLVPHMKISCEGYH